MAQLIPKLTLGNLEFLLDLEIKGLEGKLALLGTSKHLTMPILDCRLDGLVVILECFEEKRM
jgi:hypothetical protein